MNPYGTDWGDGFTHLFEGWVIFLSCIVILFLLAPVMLFFRADRIGLIYALDLDTDGLGTQAARLRHVMPSRVMIASAVVVLAAGLAWKAVPQRGAVGIEREPLSAFPAQVGDWQRVGRPQSLSPSVERSLGADDYHLAEFARVTTDQGVNLSIAWLERTDMARQMNSETPFNINRAIIQKGEQRMLVYYWFEQKGRRIAWDFAAKYRIMVDGITTGRTDGALVRPTTVIGRGETDEQAEARLRSVLEEAMTPLPRFVPTGA